MTIEEVILLDPNDNNFSDDMLDFMVEHVPFEFHMRKAMEECFELGEVLAKTLNKSTNNRPPRARLAEEFGDLTLRMMMVFGTLYKDSDNADGIEEGLEAVGAAFQEKLKKMLGWVKEGKLYNLKF